MEGWRNLDYRQLLAKFLAALEFSGRISGHSLSHLRERGGVEVFPVCGAATLPELHLGVGSPELAVYPVFR